MAKVSMDASEYEAMKKNAELLEKAKLESENLHKKIDKMNKERLEELQASQDKVVVENKTILEEILLTQNHTYDGHDILLALGIDPAQVIRYRGAPDMDRLIRILFSKNKHITESTDIKIKGLKKTLEEIRPHLEAEVADNYRESINEAADAKDKLYKSSRTIDELHRKLKESTGDFKITRDSLDATVIKLEKAEEHINRLEDEVVEANNALKKELWIRDNRRDAIEDIEMTLSSPRGIFSNGSLLREIDDIISELKKG